MSSWRLSENERGQAHTLEAVLGAILLLLAITFALQVTVVTPLSASTSSQHIEGQQRAIAQGVLANAAEEGALEESVLYWNDSAGSFHDLSVRDYYTSGPPDNRFGEMLTRAFEDDGLAYNVYFVFQTPEGDNKEKRMVYQGVPSDNAVSATRTITLHDNDRLVDADGSVTNTTVSDAQTFYIRNGPADAGGESHGLYNVVRIEVVVWRI